MNAIRLLDFVASAAHATLTPTLMVRISSTDRSGHVSIDRLAMLGDDALSGLQAEDVAIVEYDDDMALGTAFELVRNACEAGCPFQVRIDAFPAMGRQESWSSSEW